MSSYSCKGAPDRLGPNAARWRDDHRAASAVEFALLAPIVIALVLGTLMVGMLFFAKSEMDLVTEKTAREVMTGQVTTSTQLKSALCANTSGLFNCNNFMVNLQSYSTLASMQTASPTLTYNSGGGVSNTWAANFGSVGSIMVMQVMYQYPTIAGPLFSFATQSNGSNLMISTAVFVNE